MIYTLVQKYKNTPVFDFSYALCAFVNSNIRN